MTYNLPIEQIENSYDFKIEKIEPIKGSYRLSTNKGKKLVKVWNDQETVMVAYGLREKLAHNGYRTIDRFIRTVSGKPYIQWENEFLIVTDWMDGVIPVITSEKQIKKIGQHLAKLHIALSAIDVDNVWEPWSNQFGRGLQHFRQIKDKISKKSKKSEFDEAVLSHIESHEEQINQSILMATKIEKNNFHTARGPQWCHGNIELKSFRIDQYDEPWLIQLGLPVVDTPSYDLAKYLVHLYIKSNFQEELILSTLDTYQETIPLQKEEKLWILTYITYPHHLWKFLYIRYISGFSQPRISDDEQYLQLLGLQKELERLYRSLYRYFRL